MVGYHCWVASVIRFYDYFRRIRYASLCSEGVEAGMNEHRFLSACPHDRPDTCAMLTTVRNR